MWQLSKRVENIFPPQLGRIRQRLNEAESRGVEVYRGDSGDVEEDLLMDPHALVAFQQAITSGKTKYPPTQGTNEFRDAVVRKLNRDNGVQLHREDVLATVGGTHGLFCALSSIVNSGDRVLLPVPFWGTLDNMVKFVGGRPEYTLLDGNMQLDLDDIKNKFERRNIKAIVVNTPHNPSGAVTPMNTLKTVGELCEKHGVRFIGDFPYESLVYDPKHQLDLSLAPVLLEHGVGVFSNSKTQAVTGLRVGYVVSRDEVFVEAMDKVIGHSTYGVSTPAQIAMTAALINDKEAVDARRVVYGEKRRLLLPLFHERGIPVVGDGAYYLYPEFSQKAIDRLEGKSLFDFFVSRGIGCVPGEVFGPEGYTDLSRHVRIGYSRPSLEQVRQVVEPLGRALDELL